MQGRLTTHCTIQAREKVFLDERQYNSHSLLLYSQEKGEDMACRKVRDARGLVSTDVRWRRSQEPLGPPEDVRASLRT